MFVVTLTYKSIELIDQHLVAHREFLATGYEKNYFIVSGPMKPRTGGIIFSQLKDKKQLEDILSNDPFKLHDLATYDIVEFEAVKYHKDFEVFVG